MSEPRSIQNKKRSVRIAGHDTSITLEDDFWDILKEMAKDQNISLSTLITEIDQSRAQNPAYYEANLSSMLRVFALRHIQNKD